MRVHTSIRVTLCTVLLAVCGGGGNSETDTGGPAQLSGTLAYVATACRETPSGVMMRETLRVQHGENAAVDVADYAGLGTGGSSQCRLFTASRSWSSPRLGAFPRLTVSPDGARVGFELSDDFSLIMAGVLDPETEGFFVVDADGGGLRKLAPPSRVSGYYLVTETVFRVGDFKFTPDGSGVVFTDIGPGPAGEDATQIFLTDVTTGFRRQLTQLPLAVAGSDVPPGAPAVAQLSFLDDATIGFLSFANAGGLNPSGTVMTFTVRTDGSGEIEALPEASAIPGATVSPAFRITGDQPTAGIIVLPERPVGPPVSGVLPGTQEIFLRDGNDLLQLTVFHRADTSVLSRVSRDREQVFLTASADPFGTNPYNNCQLFSIDRTGAGLRQITNYNEGQASLNGCSIILSKPLGCLVDVIGEDTVTGSLVWRGTCDPLGTNPNGSQIFALRPDGTGVRQLTDLAGFSDAVNGGEGVGIFAFAGGAP